MRGIPVALAAVARSRLDGAVRWIVDANNVVGAGADGWWNDRIAASARVVQSVAEWSRERDDDVTMVFDGAPEDRLTELAGGRLVVSFATRRGRDAADDRIVEIVDEEVTDPSSVVVVTSDRGLRARLPTGVATEGAGRFRSRVGLASGGRRR